MKKIILLVPLTVAFLFSQTASAGGFYGNRGYSSFGNHHYSSRHYPSYRNYDRGYRSGFSLSYGSRGHYGGNRYRHRNYDSSNFVGGLLLGSLLTYPTGPIYSELRRSEPARYRSIYNRYPVVTDNNVNYVTRPANQGITDNEPLVTGRKLLRDLDGNCFERIVDESGNEIRVEIEAEECNY